MTLRTRFILLAMIAVAAVAIVMFAEGHFTKAEVEQRFENATLNGKAVLWKKIINGQLLAMDNDSSTLKRNRDVLEAIYKEDNVLLAENTKSTYDRLSADKVIDHLQIYNLQQEAIYTSPDIKNPDAKNAIVEAAIKENALASGLVRDGNGKLSAAVAFPLFRRGKSIGVGVYYKNLQDAIIDFKTNDDSEVVLVAEEGAIEYSTDQSFYNSLAYKLPVSDGDVLDVLDSNNKIYAVAVQTIKSRAGERIARIVSIHDSTESYQTQRSIRSAAIIVIVLVLLVVVFGLYFVINRSFKPLNIAIDALRDIAEGEGDLTRRLSVSGRNEISSLSIEFNKFADKIQGLVRDVGNATGQLSSAAGQMRSITQETSEGVSNQQTQTDMVATAINEMVATVQEVARNATQAAEAAMQADVEASNGRAVVKTTTAAINDLANEVERASEVIHRLEDDSNSIGSVLDVIRGIAEQTNLLALNAAIEAARAGEQGRGFAVVADEVRTLASRTQESTKEIQGMIEGLQGAAREAVQVMEQSKSYTESGVARAAEATTSLESITRAVATIRSMNDQIASASEQQNSVTEEINQNIVTISQIAEHTSMGAEQTKAASEQLTHLADELQSLVGQFRV